MSKKKEFETFFGAIGGAVFVGVFIMRGIVTVTNFPLTQSEGNIGSVVIACAMLAFSYRNVFLDLFRKKEPPSLAHELSHSTVIKEKVKDNNYATDLYRAFCNVKWFKKGSTITWGCSWRTSGGIVAELRSCGEDYLDFYCAGDEGRVTDEIRNDLEALGWHPVESKDV